MFNSLCAIAPDDSVCESLKSRVKFKGLRFKNEAMKEKKHKLECLINDTVDVTPAHDDHKQFDEHKTGKKRKWIKKAKYQRLQKQKKKQKVSVVFNYSKISLSPGMEKLLNRGLNFSIMPLKLNMTQVLVDFNKFERSMLWTEFWANVPKEEYKPPIFKKVKTNLPTKHPTPAGLKVFLNAVQSEIEDPQNRNKCRPNLPPDELEGLNQLIQLQKDRVITIKPCDKGAGVIILDFEDYMNSCYKHLESE